MLPVGVNIFGKQKPLRLEGLAAHGRETARALSNYYYEGRGKQHRPEYRPQLEIRLLQYAMAQIPRIVHYVTP